MRGDAFLKELNRLKRDVFTLREAAAILHKDNRYTSLYLQRMAKNNRIRHIIRGIYATVNATILDIACSMAAPSYVTMLTALHYHGLINQFPGTIVVFNSRISRHLHLRIDEGEYDIKFVRVKPSMLFGYRTIGGSTAMADPEKAIIDALYMPALCPSEYIGLALKELVKRDGSLDKLIEYVVRTRSKITTKRLKKIYRQIYWQNSAEARFK